MHVEDAYSSLSWQHGILDSVQHSEKLSSENNGAPLFFLLFDSCELSTASSSDEVSGLIITRLRILFGLKSSAETEAMQVDNSFNVSGKRAEERLTFVPFILGPVILDLEVAGFPFLAFSLSLAIKKMK